MKKMSSWKRFTFLVVIALGHAVIAGGKRVG